MNRAMPTSPADHAWPRAYDPWVVESLRNGPKTSLHVAGFLASKMGLSLWDPRLGEITGRMIRHALKAGRVRVREVRLIAGQHIEVLEAKYPRRRKGRPGK